MEFPYLSLFLPILFVVVLSWKPNTGKCKGYLPEPTLFCFPSRQHFPMRWTVRLVSSHPLQGQG